MLFELQDHENIQEVNEKGDIEESIESEVTMQSSISKNISKLYSKSPTKIKRLSTIKSGMDFTNKKRFSKLAN